MPDDKLTLMQEAREEALETILDADRAAKAEILRPALGTKLSKDERLAAQRVFLADVPAAEAQYDELTARFQLSDDAPIPRRFVNRAIQAAKEVQEAEREEPPEVGLLRRGRNGVTFDGSA